MKVIDEGVRRGDLELILRTGGRMALAALVGILCVLARNLCSGTASQRFGADVRRGLFEKLLRLAPRCASASKRRYCAWAAWSTRCGWTRGSAW